MFENNIASNQICKALDKQHILIQGTRSPQAHKLLCNTLNGTMSAPENVEGIQKLIKIIEKQPSNNTIKKFMIGWSDEEKEGTFTHLDTGWQFNRTKFGLSFGLKNGFRFHFDSVTCLNYQFLDILIV